MLIYVLGDNFQKIGVIDNASSAIFTQRYNNDGDFEIYVSADDDIVQLLTNNQYIYRDGDTTLYVINDRNISTDIEDGSYITVSGSNITSILNRRIIWNQTNANDTVENVIRKYIDENAIDTDAARIIPRLRLGEIVGFADTIKIQKTGQNLLEAIQELCKLYQYGYRISFDGTNLTFELYQGQHKNVYFSPEFDNLLSSKYNYSNNNFKNVALVAGEGEGTSRKTASVGDAVGMDRYEEFIDARNISTNNGEISQSDYLDMLSAKGSEKLSESIISEKFEGEVSTENTYKFGVDYNLGDIVTIQNEYGMQATSRIIEAIECEDENGYSFIPTFDAWEV